MPHCTDLVEALCRIHLAYRDPHTPALLQQYLNHYSVRV